MPSIPCTVFGSTFALLTRQFRKAVAEVMKPEALLVLDDDPGSFGGRPLMVGDEHGGETGTLPSARSDGNTKLPAPPLDYFYSGALAPFYSALDTIDQ